MLAGLTYVCCQADGKQALVVHQGISPGWLKSAGAWASPVTMAPAMTTPILCSKDTFEVRMCQQDHYKGE